MLLVYWYHGNRIRQHDLVEKVDSSWKGALVPWMISMFTCILKHHVRHQPQPRCLCATSQAFPGLGGNTGVRNLALGILWRALGLGVWRKGDCRLLTPHPSSLSHQCLPSLLPQPSFPRFSQPPCHGGNPPHRRLSVLFGDTAITYSWKCTNSCLGPAFSFVLFKIICSTLPPTHTHTMISWKYKSTTTTRNALFTPLPGSFQDADLPTAFSWCHSVA